MRTENKMKIEIKKCDLCGFEMRSDNKVVHWSFHGGAVVLNFDGCAGVQGKFEWDYLCIDCAGKVKTSIQKAVDSILPKELPPSDNENPDTRKEVE